MPKGFTLVELLTTIAIIGILLGLLLPNLAAVQATAKAGGQAATLQALGRAFLDFATLDGQGRLSSSAFDHLRDGDATKVGWVADVVNNRFANPNKSLDPVNRMKINEKFTDLAGTSNSGSLNNYRWRSTVTNRPSDGLPVTNVTSIRGTSYFGSQQTVWDDGYNSNFATTWQFSRGDNGITSGDAYAVNANSLDGDGPLSGAILFDPATLTTADKIALMGAARVSDAGDSAFRASGNNTAESVNRFIDPSGRRVIAKVGDFTVESFTDGPAASRMTTAGQAGVYEGDASRQVHEINDIAPNCKAKKVKTSFGTLIAGGYANIVFADGSCRRVNDTNGYGGANKGDAWIGPYPTNPHATTSGGRAFVLDDGAHDEVREEVYLGRLRTPPTLDVGSPGPD